MSKRSGNYITVDDIVDKVGADSLRFIMMTRKAEAPLDFDFAKAIEESKDNPIFYIQYAHARISSVLRQSVTKIPTDIQKYIPYLTHDVELNLIKELIQMPNLIFSISENYEIHRLSFYLIELAGKFHSYWNLGKDDHEMKFINDNKNITIARLILLQSIQNVIALGLDCLI